MRAFMLPIAVTVALSCAAVALAVSQGAQKRQLPRDDVYYEITNDEGDHGNYWELYHVPVTDQQGRKRGVVYCAVYSDQIGDAGGGGPSCNWEAFNQGVPGDRPFGRKR